MSTDRPPRLAAAASVREVPTTTMQQSTYDLTSVLKSYPSDCFGRSNSSSRFPPPPTSLPSCVSTVTVSSHVTSSSTACTRCYLTHHNLTFSRSYSLVIIGSGGRVLGAISVTRIAVTKGHELCVAAIRGDSHAASVPGSFCPSIALAPFRPPRACSPVASEVDPRLSPSMHE